MSFTERINATTYRQQHRDTVRHPGCEIPLHTHTCKHFSSMKRQESWVKFSSGNNRITSNRFWSCFFLLHFRDELVVSFCPGSIVSLLMPDQSECVFNKSLSPKPVTQLILIKTRDHASYFSSRHKCWPFCEFIYSLPLHNLWESIFSSLVITFYVIQIIAM